MRSALTRREFGKIILGASPLVLAPQLAMAAAKEIFGVPVGSVKAIDGVPIGSIKEYMGVEVLSETCELYAQETTQTNTTGLGRYNNENHKGIIFDDASSGKICQLDVLMTSRTGDVTTKAYYAEVWLLNGSRALTTLVGRSSKVAGTTWSNNTWIQFAFPTDAQYDCTGSNEYALVFKQVDSADDASTAGKYDGSNYLSIGYRATNAMTGCVARAWWGASALTDSSATSCINMKVYTKQ
jgi:hypothetical protein